MAFIKVTWTGRGWLSLVITFLSGIAALRTSFGSHGWSAVLVAEVVLLAGAAVNLLIAVPLNSAKTPQGRKWHPIGSQHTLWGMPMQDWSGVIVAMGLLTAAGATGVLIAPLAGWLVFAAIAASALGALVFYRRRAARQRAARRANARPMGPRERESFDAAMGTFFGQGSPASRARGGDVQTTLAIQPAQAAAGATVPVRVVAAVACTACRATGGAGSSGVRLRPCQVCSGQGRVPGERTLSVNIPAGVGDGTQVRLAGYGEAGLRGGPAGDLYVRLQVASAATGTGGG